MQNTLNPGETFTINRILKDHTDATTYYVRAVVYDSVSRAVLATKDLTDNGSRWFSASYKVPHDNVFQNGKRILIVTSVYSDSGYTTKSENHYDEPEEYLVQQRWNPSVNFGGGDGGYDHKAIIKEVSLLIDEKLAPMQEIEPLEFPQFDYDFLIKTIVAQVCETMNARFDALPAPEKPDFAPIMERSVALAQMILERPKFEKTDLSQITALVSDARSVLDRLRTDTTKVLEEIIVRLMEENRRLGQLTNSNGGTVKLSFEEGNDKKRRELQRIGSKYRIGV